MTDEEALAFAEQMLDSLNYRLETSVKFPCRNYYEKQSEMLVRAIWALRYKLATQTGPEPHSEEARE